MISDHGRVLSFKGRSKLILCAKIMGTGYETVILPNKGVCIEYKIHRLVAKAFIPNPEQLPQINHLDGNTMNNHVSNLEWCDAYTNMMHAIRTGLRRTGVGSHQTPFAVTDATGKVLRAYPSMKEMVREERLKPAHRNWLILQLKHPDRVKQHALRVQHHRGDAFIMVQTRPDLITVLNRPSSTWFSFYRLSFRHPSRRYDRTGKRCCSRRSALYRLEPSVYRHLLHWRIGQERPACRHTDGSAT